ncbi:DVU_1553 family AMP-dependent CoA ligase [Clostridium autoethanogenum]|uniref:AMP-binding protein n=1 Tax=Clostridium autoethanogenum DSM 10061 TaxID=1341692 RepID=A0ABN4BEV3_9CLOT|nr:AMP-binding protein [Clostridium autoethanogenum]AGY74696.1 AMP-binding protein [Clostridium autoethanogenum DSM 10061]ALU34877.1 AMP-dependent synthetase and ligase [Clostridium autoethanogenum DSM 10061]OVY51598.1 Phenylacetate-coenzyme A ligase [Clostridium autoethanogenum]
MKLTPLEAWIVDKTGIKEKSREALENYQLNKIRKVIDYGKKYSKFYKEYLKNIEEDDIKSFKYFEKIPFTLPEHIKQNSNNFLCVPQRDVARIVTLRTSGTSGEEKRIYFTEKDLDLTVEFFKYGMQCIVNKNDRVLVLLPGNSHGSIGDLLKKALKDIDITCYVQGVLVNPKDTAEFIKEKGIDCIVGIPLQVLYFSRVESETFKANIKKILLSADYVPETLIREITHKFNCKVFTHYGMTEMGYGGGVECEALSGYHMRENDLYFEVINPRTGKVAKDGEYGEIVFTTLTREGMPLIRYKTGDIGCFKAGLCACGTFLKTMERVHGRMENKIVIGKNKFLSMRDLDEIILSFEEVINYNVYIEKKNILYIDIAVKDEEDFYKLKGRIKNSIEKIPSVRESLIDGTLEIVLKYMKKSIEVKNSMVKRKIYDYRWRG